MEKHSSTPMTDSALGAPVAPVVFPLNTPSLPQGEPGGLSGQEGPRGPKGDLWPPGASGERVSVAGPMGHRMGLGDPA